LAAKVVLGRHRVYPSDDPFRLATEHLFLSIDWTWLTTAYIHRLFERCATSLATVRT